MAERCAICRDEAPEDTGIAGWRHVSLNELGGVMAPTRGSFDQLSEGAKTVALAMTQMAERGQAGPGVVIPVRGPGVLDLICGKDACLRTWAQQLCKTR